ncbi:melanoregulin-like [Entelurus aequoreus]|uniref:melanoregulin-like n=1 Tax=Entelurus aequoreus TaxID=161455 RepID=UPI002B1E2B72|nr:melanoregulin-like [Entelurus aequoreus]
MGASLTLCCCHYHFKYHRGETNAFLRMHAAKASKTPQPPSNDSGNSDAEEECHWGPQSTTRRNRGTNTHGASCIRRESERELQAFISMRDQVDKATEEWEKLNYDIHTLRYARREVRARWKKILLQLGYQSEADALLYVNKQSRLNRDQESLSRATEPLTQLLDHTSLFPPGTGHKTRYLYVMDRLVCLDSAEDFVRLATEKYPKAKTQEG